jgi:hypothetical protein
MAAPPDQRQKEPVIPKGSRDPRPSGPSLPNPEDRLDYLSTGVVRPVQTPVEQRSTVHFLVHGALPELRAYAQEKGWLDQGYTQLAVPWQEMHWTTDGWKTAHVVQSSDVPSPVVNGFFHLPRVAPGTEVEFALHVGISCRRPEDSAGARDVGDLWLNNAGRNYLQKTK